MLAIITSGVAPALALLSFFYLKDKITEPLPLIIRTFISGCLIVFPIMFIQYAFQSDQIGNLFIQSFFVVAFLEEFFKWFLFLYLIYQHTEFDAHYDGIVYAVSISLGFASIENILYLLVNGIQYAFTRALFPVSSHALFGVIMGYYFGKAKMNNHYVGGNIFLALIIPIILHGIYNFILGTVHENWALFAVPFMIILWFFGLHRMKIAITA
ncbi:glutamic-type intramembrane protease PrsW [Ornithinibacillus bavariensis]|uniref:Protease PrsW n=1 Tax=Ornithinibacillus bavariensis TaxID=545502 RepID=A0A919XDF6_9BACI|nr:glutamic-type intramembrane protease PrsW [Ornithinibacillus bavariensis]GIO28473.1 protease PrsW [Ornithinibacillus bavariensis]HAM81200.1 PrsW family intramembrane metalloprotease [Ornithinibacillus sp.]